MERLEGRVDRVIDEKSDKTDVDSVRAEVKDLKIEFKADINGVEAEIKDLRTELKADINGVEAEIKDLRTELKADIDSVRTEIKADVNGVKTEINELRGEVRSHGQRLDRIETGIKTLQWTMTAGIAVLGLIIAFMKVF